MRGAVIFGAIAIACAGCFGSGYEVVRLHEGRPRAERFVSEEAYAASLEASIAEARGDWKTAITALEKAHDEDPDADDLLARLGAAECKSGDRDAAYQTLRAVIDSDPTLERAYTARAECTLLLAGATSPFAGGADAHAFARKDLEHAVSLDPDALPPALDLAGLDLLDGATASARARVEEAILLHPTSARAFRLLTDVCVRAKDVRCATDAALATARLDTDEGARAKAAARMVADRAGVAAYALSLRDVRPTPELTFPAHCAPLYASLSTIASKGTAKELHVAVEGAIATCPELEVAATFVEVSATWTPSEGAAIELRALEAPVAYVRRWGARMRLRHLTLEGLLAPDALPKIEDRETLAISLAAEALKAAPGQAPNDAMELAASAFAMAREEPTVARLVAATAKLAGKPAGDPTRTMACALARTAVEKEGC